MTDLPQSYEQLELTLARAESDLDAAETQGLLCGLLCASGRLDEPLWLREVFEDIDVSSAAVDQCRKALNEQAAYLRTVLYDGSLELRLLLPEDEAMLDDRAEALGNWCHGFLYGFGLGGIDQAEIRSDEVRDLLKDMSEISRIGLEGEEGNEEDEAAFAEIVEYLRVGVTYILEELHPVKAPPRLQ